MNLFQELLLKEGFMDYSVGGSDAAADAYHHMCDEIAKSLETALKYKNSEYNTPGIINVAMLIDEHLLPGQIINEGLKVIAIKLLKDLKAELKLMLDSADKEKQFNRNLRGLDASNFKERITVFKKLITSCEKYIKVRP